MKTLPTVLSVLLLSACGEPTAEPAPAESAGGEAADVAHGAPEKAWADRTFDERREYMGRVVVPAMKEMFQRFDATEFAEFGCQTCHGANAQEVRFRMPNGLHPLDPNAFPTPDSPDPEIARAARFMGEEVKPRMTELLGAEPFDPATGRGFGCFACHAMVQ